MMIPLKWQLPVLLVALLALFWLFSPILSPFVLAVILAWLGNPMVLRLQRLGCGRSTAVLLVFSLIFLLITLALLVLLPLLWQQGVALIERLPVLFDWFRRSVLPWLAAHMGREASELFDPAVVQAAVQKVLQQHWMEVGSAATLIVGYISRSGMALLLFFSFALLVPILGFYFLRDWPMMAVAVRNLIPRPMEARVMQLLEESNTALLGFLRGQVLVMFLLGVIFGFGLWLIGLDSWLLIGFLGGLVSFVPYLGATFVAILSAIASLIQFGSLTHLGWVALVFTVSQLIESYLLTPNLVGDRIGLHPVAVIFTIMAGGQLFGFVGMLLALPVAAVLNVLFRHMTAHYLGSPLYGMPPEAAAPPTSDL